MALNVILTLKLINTNTKLNPKLLPILALFNSLGGVVTQCMPENK